MTAKRSNPGPDKSARKGLLTRPIVRVGIVAACFVGFLAIASIINPESSVARSTKLRNESGFELANRTPNAKVEAAPVIASTGAGLPLGSLTGPTSTVEILGGPDGFSYSIFDASGMALLVGASSEDVYKTLPDFDVRTLMADVDVESGY